MMGPNLPSSPSVAALFEQARATQRAGQTQQAVQLFRRVVELDPNHSSAWQALGQALQDLRQPGEAVAAYQNSLRVRPGSVEVLYSLAVALADQGRRGEAISTYRQVLQLAPRHVEAQINLAVILAEQGDVIQAIDLLRQAVRTRPEAARAHLNLGVALCQLNKLEEAEHSLREALRLQPNYVDAWYNLGNVLGQQNRRDESIASYRQAIQLRPDHSGALNNLGLALSETGRPGEAVILLQQAVRLQPNAVSGHNNLGLALAALGRFAEAEAAYQEALRLDPRHADAHSNRGNAFKELGRFEEALACYQMALLLNPDAASIHYNRSLALLHAGDYEQGWPAYEWRWRRKNAKSRLFPRPRWDGSPLEGKTILLWCEQGLGDVLMFMRYARLVKDRGGRVLVECPGFLIPLLKKCDGVDQLMAEGETLPPYDVQCPLLSLPGLLRTTVTTIPAAVPYLHAEPERVHAWQQRLTGMPSFKVGVVWQGNPHFQWDRFRSIPLRAFAPLAQVEGVQLISLQKGAGIEQLRMLRGRFEVKEVAEELDAGGEAFLDTAAIMANLDLVVTADTATAHLAGALAAPVWVALSAVADWRWLWDREETPWYPTMRLFRQKQLGDWAGVFERMAQQLQRLVADREKEKMLQVEMSPGELLDRLTILEIKAERIKDMAKQERLHAELKALQRIRGERLPVKEELTTLQAELKAINEAIWDVEDELRLCESQQDFGERFVTLARSVYRNNDQRSALKHRINALLSSGLDELKAHPVYS